MSTTSENTACAVVIEVDVDPENQTELIEEILSWGNPPGHPGFVSASVDARRDGCRVLNYAQWQSERAYEEFRAAGAPEESDAKMEAIRRRGARLREIRAYDVVRA